MQKIIIFSILAILISSCKKEQDLGNLQEFFYLRNKGADMPVYIEGNAKSEIFVIVIHGGPGGDAKVYNLYNKEFSNTLEENYAMVYYDQRGSGTSTGKYSSKDLTVAQHVDDLEVLIQYIFKTYGTQNKIFLMGHSWGGTLGTAFLLKTGNQEKIAGWIEVDGAHKFSCRKEIYYGLFKISNLQKEKSKFSNQWQEIYDFVSKLDTNNISDIDFSRMNSYAHKCEQYLTYDGKIKRDNNDIGGVFNYLWFSGNNPITAKFNLRITNSTMFEEIKNIDYTPELYKITIPSLVLWGEHDYVLPVELGHQAYNSLGSTNKKIVTFPNSGHSVMSNEMYDFLYETKMFINEVSEN